jgi:hypothetical protein
LSAEDGAPPLSVDPTLGDGDGGATGPVDDFPDTASGTQLVLYQTGDGSVELRWHLAPAAIAHARRVFPAPSARPLLRLRLTGADGGGARTLADAGLDDDTAAASGLAHYGGDDAQGRLVAEIGLATGDGGWLLIARSNGLSAAAPVGAAFVRERRYAEQRQPDGLRPDTLRPDKLRPAATDHQSPDPAHPPGDDAAPAMRIEPQGPVELPVELPAAFSPEFPLIEPELSGLELAAPPSMPLPLSQHGLDPGDEPTAQSAEEPPPGGVVPRLRRSKPGAGSVEPGQSDPAPTASGRPESGTEPPSADPRAPIAGSGPLQRAVLDASLSAELLVRGSAPPNTLLDLGGHPYRVGPGGRFELRVPIRDPELVQRLLSSLPRLPVADRDGG